MSSITELVYTSIKLSISLNNIRFMFFVLPKHRIDRHSVNLHARVVIFKLQSDHCVQQSCNKRACNKQACNKNDYMERLHPMMKYGNFIEVFNNDVYES